MPNLLGSDISSVISLNDKIKFSESKKQSVTKCEKNNIEFTENNDFEEYWNLLAEVLSKFDTKPVHSRRNF
jgi:transcription elongation factor GreA-like protein